MSLDLALIEFVQQLHDNNDPVNNFGHVLRLKHMIKKISRETDVPDKHTNISVYFHGLKVRDQNKVGNFLLAFGHNDREIDYLRELETFTDLEKIPQTEEQKVMHDAHILEGGAYFGVIKELIKSLYEGQTFEYAINTFETHILPRYRCYFDYTRRLMKEKVDISKSMIYSLRDNLPKSV